MESKLIIAGPCAVESRDQFEGTLKYLLELGVRYIRVGLHKPRTSSESFQGLGNEYYSEIIRLKKEKDFFVVSEILSENDFSGLDKFVDVFQVGCRNMQNFGLLKFLAKNTDKPILLKRGISATLDELLNSAKYFPKQYAEKRVYLCLRGIRTFEQINSEMRNTPDLGAILELKKSGLPIIFDPSHATGKSEFFIPVAKAAMLLGADGLIIETSIDPSRALCDGRQTLNEKQFTNLLEEVKKIR